MIYTNKEYILLNLIYSNAKKEKLNYDEIIYLFKESLNKKVNLFREFESLNLKDTKYNTKTFLNLLHFFQKKEYLKYENDVSKIEKKCNKNNIKMMFFEDEKFPSNLKDIPDSPIMLYYKGEFPNTKKILTIAGSREISKYGKKIVNKVIELFSKEDYSVLSGLASGIDTQAHLSALRHNLKTFAILGQGLGSKIYPFQNTDLSEKILEYGGCLISEIEPSKNPNRDYFLQRNRLQVAFAERIFIGEIKENGGGTLTTINYALEYNKKLYIWNPILLYEKGKFEKSFLGNLILFDEYSTENKKNKLFKQKEYIKEKAVEIKLGIDFENTNENYFEQLKLF